MDHQALVLAGDEEWQETFASALTRPGWRILRAHDGIHGLEIVRSERIDLVLVDDSLDGMQQMEFLLNLIDLSRSRPVMLLAGRDLDRYRHIWSSIGVFAADTRPSILKQIDRVPCLRISEPAGDPHANGRSTA